MVELQEQPFEQQRSADPTFCRGWKKVKEIFRNFFPLWIIVRLQLKEHYEKGPQCWTLKCSLLIRKIGENVEHSCRSSSPQIRNYVGLCTWSHFQCNRKKSIQNKTNSRPRLVKFCRDWVQFNLIMFKRQTNSNQPLTQKSSYVFRLQNKIIPG